MLISSLTWSTTHASVLLRTRTVTGSRPTGILAVFNIIAPPSVKISSVLFAVFTANSLVPSGVMSSGCTCALS